MTGDRPMPGFGTGFVGRVAVLDALAADVDAGGIVTLIGPAGAGKSRWAAEVARRARLSLQDGSWWVDLGPATPASVAERVAVVVGAPTTPGVSAVGSLVGHLRSARGLLVLDGCEPVRSETGQLVDMIRRECPGVRVLITCQSAVAVEGERVRPVLALWSVADAVALFGSLSGAAGSGIGEEAAIRLCHAVGGLPLAVELVAARAGQAPGVQVLEQIGPLRLSDVIGWSVGLLTGTDRSILARLSVFQGGFSAADAEAVAGEGLRLGVVTVALGTLAEAGLLRSQLMAAGEEPPTRRLRLPAPVRRLAAIELAGSGESARIADRHAEHFAGVAAAAERALLSRQQAAWVNRLGADRCDLLAALGWLADRPDIEPALRMAGALGRYWWLSGRFGEGWRVLRSVLDRPAASRPTVGRAAALHALGLATFHHETDETRARRFGVYLAEAVRIYTDLDDRHGLAWALRDLGSHYNGAGDLAQARKLFGQSLDIAREVGDVAATGVAATYLGIAACYAGEGAEARHRLEEAVVLLSGRGGADELARAQFYLACLACDERDPVAARARFKAMVDGNDAVPSFPYGVGFALDGLARLAAAEVRYPDALRLSGAAGAAHARCGTSGGGAYSDYIARGLVVARRAVGEPAAVAYVAEGSRWTVAEAVDRGFRRDPDPAAAASRLRPREVEVLRMVADGLGDAEIAKALFLSRRTVGNHLASAYRKLGVHSRTAAIHLARRGGLLTN